MNRYHAFALRRFGWQFIVLFLCTTNLFGCGEGKNNSQGDGSVVVTANLVGNHALEISEHVSIKVFETGQEIFLGKEHTARLVIPPHDTVTFVVTDATASAQIPQEIKPKNFCDSTIVDEIVIDYIDEPNFPGVRGFREQALIKGKRFGQSGTITCDKKSPGDIGPCDPILDAVSPPAPDWTPNC